MRPPSLRPADCAFDVRHVSPATLRLSPRASRSSQSRDDWKQTFSFATTKSIGRGASGTVFAIDSERVIKVFADDEEGRLDLAREKEIFDKLQSLVASEYVITCEEQWGSGLVLERLVTTLREQLREFVMDVPDVQHPLARQWSLESCKGISFLHDNGVIHGDIGCQNILVSASGHAKLCDFAGSKIGEKAAWIAYEIRSQHPLYSGQQPSILTEIFAVGSVLYEICTLSRPYIAETDAAVQKKFLAGEFPLDSVKDLRMKKIIGKCWKGSYYNVSDVCKDLEEIEGSS